MSDSTAVKIKIRIFADKKTKVWLGAFAMASATLLKTTPKSYLVEEGVDEDAEFLKGARVHCIKEQGGALVAAWRVANGK
jgi:hypothetical protein